MNFFDQQAIRRRQSLVLLVCFLLTMAAMGVVIQAIVVGLSMLLREQSSFLHPSTPALAMIGFVWFTVVAGGFFRYLDVRGGGAVLARRFGAVHASDRARFDKEQRLLNVVAEMAIASSTPQPEVFILRKESSVNAFVLGAEEARHVIVVTQGALDAFDRPELQAVIAHEFGHIKNGDLPINMRLLIALGGLMAIDEVGQLLIGDAALSRDEPVPFHPGVIVGFLLCLIGSIGVFSGQLIRAAFARQREYLADATAVQFTRNPIALACALDIIRQRQPGPALHSLYARELAHLCFQSGSAVRWHRRLTVSHPQIRLRINAIEPHFAVKRRKLEQFPEHTAGLAMQGHRVGRMGDGAMSTPSGDITHSPGSKIIARDVDPGALADHILLLLPDRDSCLAVLFAMFVSQDANRRHRYYLDLSHSFGDGFVTQVRELAGLIHGALRTDRLGIIEHATEVLSNSLEPDSRQHILLQLKQLSCANDDYDLMRYATLQLIRRKLGVELKLTGSVAGHTPGGVQGRHVRTFESMGNEFALLLSLMVETSGAPPAVLDAEFERVLRCYTQTRYPRRTARETGIIKELEAAFQTLYLQPKPIRQAFVQHCLEIVEHDGYVARAERTLLDLFAASLECHEPVS